MQRKAIQNSRHAEFTNPEKQVIPIIFVAGQRSRT